MEIRHRWNHSLLATGETASRAAESARADLRWANLSETDLSRTDLRWANLSETDLSGANLSETDLSRTDLRWANLSETDLSGANLRGANLSGADLSGANLSGADIPVIPDIDAAILTAISAPGHQLAMSSFHACATTHCRAGWAIHLAGDAGYALEKKIGPCAAGALIYAASRPTKRVPDFYASDKEAINDIQACASEQVNP